MRLELNGRHRDDVLALFDAVKPRLFHLGPRGNIFNADDFCNWRQMQGLRDFLNHVLRCAENQDSVRFGCFNGLADFFRVAGQNEDGPSDGHNPALFFFRRMAGNDFAVLDEDAVIDDGIGIILMRHNQCAVAFAGPARTD